MDIYCVYPAISKRRKQLPKCLKIIETRVVLIVFNGGICDVRTYNVNVSEMLYSVHDLITLKFLTGTN